MCDYVSYGFGRSRGFYFAVADVFDEFVGVDVNWVFYFIYIISCVCVVISVCEDVKEFV